MTMWTILALAAALSAPLQARLTSNQLQRSTGGEPAWVNRVEVELHSAQQRSLRLCPQHAEVTTERRVGSGFTPVDRYPAFALAVGSRGQRTTACRELALAPGQPQRVAFYVRDVPGRWRAEDRYTTILNADGVRFSFVERGGRRE
jgi:hypothetical protein